MCTLHLACVWLLSNADEHMEGYRIAGPYAATRHGSAPPQPGGGSGAATSSSATSDPSAVASGRWDVVEPGSLILLVDLARRGDAAEFTRSSMTSTFNGTSNSQGLLEIVLVTSEPVDDVTLHSVALGLPGNGDSMLHLVSKRGGALVVGTAPRVSMQWTPNCLGARR